MAPRIWLRAKSLATAEGEVRREGFRDVESVQVGVKLCGDGDDGNLMSVASTGHHGDALHICFWPSHWWIVQEGQETQISLVLVLGRLVHNNLGTSMVMAVSWTWSWSWNTSQCALCYLRVALLARRSYDGVHGILTCPSVLFTAKAV
jgi:hypothetical protein